jgi:hypothetical protein
MTNCSASKSIQWSAKAEKGGPTLVTSSATNKTANPKHSGIIGWRCAPASPTGSAKPAWPSSLQTTEGKADNESSSVKSSACRAFDCHCKNHATTQTKLAAPTNHMAGKESHNSRVNLIDEVVQLRDRNVVTGREGPWCSDPSRKAPWELISSPSTPTTVGRVCQGQ